MSFNPEQPLKPGPTTTAAQNLGVATGIITSSTTSTASSTLITTSTPATLPSFTLPTPAVATTGSMSTLQFKPTQQTVLSTSTTSTSSAPTNLSSGFSFGGGLLNQLKGHIASNSQPPNLPSVISNEKKLGTGTTTISGGTTQTTTTQLPQQTTTVSTTQASGTSSFLPSQTTADKQVSQMTYEELETTVNKLIGKLTDNEEEFAKLARELNDWDKAINENYEKLLLLTETVKTVKSAQIQLSYDLDFIAIEHKDFESIVSACEKEVENYNFSQPSRHDVYQKAINVDIQIRRMCEELREVIEHLNDRLRFCESDDPVMQIGRVLNAHMESLKWVDESTTQIYDYITYLSQIQEQMKKNLPQVGN
ncbi:nuclear pore glycoprotein p62-like [Rhodnius prolixus]|uniref:Nsp1_C domain-containing protein n=2 Tax=Rhodnius TaxID=13248 RepID=T1HC22_RHOPR